MKIERVKIADLKPVEKNSRIHTEKQLNELIRSYRMFGQIRPVVIDENNVIWCGNGFYQAMVKAGETEVDAYRLVGLSQDTKKKLMIADNQIYMLGATNTTVLDEIMAELTDFEVPGYDSEVLQQLYGSIEEAAEEMSSYGKLNDDSIQRINNIAESNENAVEYHYERQAVPAAYESDESLVPKDIEKFDGVVNIQKGQRERPYVICPKCGEKIWL